MLRPKVKTCIHRHCSEPAPKGQRLCIEHLRAYLTRNAQIMAAYARRQGPKFELREKDRTHVYAVAGAGKVKIGQAIAPLERLEGLQVGSPAQLTLLGFVECNKDLESWLHKLLKPHRMHGEWFDLNAEPVAAIISLIVAKDESAILKIIDERFF